MGSEVTLKQIAKELGLSAMTVSRAINNRSNVDEKTKERILNKAREMGYTPNHIAKSLVSKKSYTIGVVVPEIAHSFFAEAIQGIEEVTFEGNYQLILTHSAENEEREKQALQTLKSKRVDGILISTAQTVEDHSLYKRIVESDTALVFFDRCVEGIGASCVSVDDRSGAYNITNHLIGHGYKKIAHLGGPLNLKISQERLWGYKEALNDNGIMIDDDLIIESGFREKGGYNAMDQLLTAYQDHPPRAVFAMNDPVAFGAMEAIYNHGFSIPEDIAIVGFSDDIRASLMKTPLTTVRQPSYDLGKRAAQKLIKMIENEDEPVENIDLLTELVVRESCGCKKQ
ncbi:LacI family DNA-binding transcriptional regulator [Rhodohalobacter sp. 614A]|uniref:LacI family DNA-binding transcriptional regulator n=1 Tax=Rhodohalobacter sp. 614A TaxID=2908649 RepID=UPI001F30B731|nr:LacI family DNA-binding transcriptional regulator [Rhodohalobacter sp. 614A]